MARTARGSLTNQRALESALQAVKCPLLQKRGSATGREATLEARTLNGQELTLDARPRDASQKQLSMSQVKEGPAAHVFIEPNTSPRGRLAWQARVALHGSFNSLRSRPS